MKKQEEQMNPNNLKYFDEDAGCTFNSKCPVCKKPTWMSERIQTIWYGKIFFRNNPTSIMKDDAVGITNCKPGGVFCYQCWNRRNNQQGGK